jgi:hypothetical protein
LWEYQHQSSANTKQSAFILVSQKEKFRPESFETKLSEFKAK